MNITYFTDTDTLLVTFNNHEISETNDINENTLVELDKYGNIVAMTIEHAKKQTEIFDFSFKQISQAV